MIKLIKKFKTILITISFAYAFFVFSLVMPSGKSIIMPGGVTQINQNIVIEEHNLNNMFYSIHVRTYDSLTFFQYMIASGNPKYNVYETTPYEKDVSLSDNIKMGQLSKRSSYQYSVIHAYTLAQIKDSSITINYQLKGARIYYRPSRLNGIHVDDLVVGIKYLDVTKMFEPNMTPTEIKEVLDLSRNSEYTLLVSKNETIYEYDINHVNGDYYLQFYPDYNITATPAFDDSLGMNSNVGGPSGGLLQTMDLYCNLVGLKINRKITGTGTLDYDGHVGKIGGAPQKVYTAKACNMDYFFITEENRVDVSGMKETNEFAGFYYVTSIEDVIAILEGLS